MTIAWLPIRTKPLGVHAAVKSVGVGYDEGSRRGAVSPKCSNRDYPCDVNSSIHCIIELLQLYLLSISY